MPLCPPQIPNGLIWYRNRLSAMRGRRPTPLTLRNFISILPWFRRLVARLSPTNTGLIHRLVCGICGRQSGTKTRFCLSKFSFPLSLSFQPSVTEAIIISATSSVFKRTYKHTVANYLSRLYYRKFSMPWPHSCYLQCNKAHSTAHRSRQSASCGSNASMVSCTAVNAVTQFSTRGSSTSRICKAGQRTAQ